MAFGKNIALEILRGNRDKHPLNGALSITLGPKPNIILELTNTSKDVPVYVQQARIHYGETTGSFAAILWPFEKIHIAPKDRAELKLVPPDLSFQLHRTTLTRHSPVELGIDYSEPPPFDSADDFCKHLANAQDHEGWIELDYNEHDNLVLIRSGVPELFRALVDEANKTQGTPFAPFVNKSGELSETLDKASFEHLVSVVVKGNEEGPVAHLDTGKCIADLISRRQKFITQGGDISEQWLPCDFISGLVNWVIAKPVDSVEWNDVAIDILANIPLHISTRTLIAMSERESDPVEKEKFIEAANSIVEINP